MFIGIVHDRSQFTQSEELNLMPSLLSKRFRTSGFV